MRRRLLLVMVGTGICLAALVLAWRPFLGPTRAERIRQTKQLAAGISMQVDDLFVQPSEGRTMLVVSCRYLGGDPNQQHYGLQGALLAAPAGPELKYGIYGQAASPFPGPGFPVLWMFSYAPEHCDRFVMRITVNAGRKDEHFVDFNLPNVPVPYH